MGKNHNLSNPASEPEHASIDVTCTVQFDMLRPVPKEKLAIWLDSLPTEARVQFHSVLGGKPQFVASWVEER